MTMLLLLLIRLVLNISLHLLYYVYFQITDSAGAINV